jgi:phage/plasmid-like protein (TIGR03299 family)
MTKHIGFSTLPMYGGITTMLETAPTSIDEALRIGGMDWNTLETANAYMGKDGNVKISPGLKSLVRSDNNTLMEVVPLDWQVLQNIDAFQLFQPLIDQGRFELQTGLSIGNRVILTGKIGGGGDVVPGDQVENYLMISNPNQYGKSIEISFLPKRLFCANMLANISRTIKATKFRKKSMALSDQVARVRHTSNMHDNLELLKDLIQIEKASFDVALYEYQAMSKIQISATKLIEVYGKAFGVEVDEVKQHTHYETIVRNFESGIAIDHPGVSGTGWAAYNAVTQFTTHQRSSKGSDDHDRTISRLNSLYFGESSRITERAHSAILALA